MFEELFKTGSGLPVSQTAVSPHLKQKFVKTTESLTLLDPQRQRNLGKTFSYQGHQIVTLYSFTEANLISHRYVTCLQS